MKSDGGTFMRLAWTDAEGPADGKIWRAKLDVRFSDTKDFRTYVINARDVMRMVLERGENLARLYIQPSDISGAKVDIDYIRFISKAAAMPLLRMAWPATSRSRARCATRCSCDPIRSSSSPSRSPSGSHTLDLGMGVLLEDKSMRFEVGLTGSDGVAAVLHDETIADVESWHDARVDLSKWAGQDVKISLRKSGNPSNVAFCGQPDRVLGA